MYIPEEQIKNLSIDQLVELYKHGYSINTSPNVRESIYPPIDSILPHSPRNKFQTRANRVVLQ